LTNPLNPVKVLVEPESAYDWPRLFEILDFSGGLLSMLDSSGDECAMIHVSMDDVSTLEHGGMSAVVGYVAHTGEWNKFNYRWMISLLQLKHPYLHSAKDIANFALVGGDGLTDEDVHLILSPFIAIVQEELIRNGGFGICILTEHEAYEKLSPKEKKFVRDPAINSFEIACAFALKSISNPLNLRNCIAIQMDESQDATRLYESYQNMKRKDEILREGLGSICFCDDTQHPPIQAADLLAHVTLRAWRNWQTEKVWPRAFRELVFNGSIPNLRVQVYGYEALKKLAELRMAAAKKMEMPEV
jgi:hypothetical protein